MRVDKGGWSCLSFAARGTVLTRHPEKVRVSEFFLTYIPCWQGWLIKNLKQHSLILLMRTYSKLDCNVLQYIHVCFMLHIRCITY